MKLDDLYIKDIITQYQQSNNLPFVQKFQEHVYHYVQTWPKYKYNCNEDICQDFVVYIIEHTEQILNSFPLQSSISFVTWFNAVLYNKFCDFAKQGLVAVEELTLGGYAPDDDLLLIVHSEYTQNENSQFSVYQVIDNMPKKDRCLWIFYYMPHQITSDLLQEIADVTELSLQQVLLIYQEILVVHYQYYQLQEAYFQKIKIIDHKISHLNNIQLKKSTHSSIDLNDKISRYKNRQYKLIRSLKKTTKYPFKVFVKLFNNYYQAYQKLKKLDRQFKKISLQIQSDGNYGKQ